ncbi:MAG: hypothetical protein WC780_13800 [Lentimicrobiaceae bacterium]|jgi:hypothetical protein
MGKWGKLYSNLWIKIADSDFDKLKQIQKDYQLKSVEEVLELLVNTHTINCLAEESREYITKSNSRIRYAGTPVSK